MENFAADLERGGGQLAISQTDYRPSSRSARTSPPRPARSSSRTTSCELLQFDSTTETGARDPAADLPAVDQQVLHPGPAARELDDPLADRPGLHGVRRLVGQSGRPSWPPRPSRTTCVEGIYGATERGHDPGRRRSASTPSATASAAPCSPAPWPTWRAKGDKRIASATFFAAQQDFAEAGDLLLFTNEDWLKRPREADGRRRAACLPSQSMADTFNSLRANDLIWSFFVNNYLMGKEPRPFDLLFWNADQTRMPKALHLFYLRKFYGDNALAKGELTLGGVKLDLVEGARRRSTCSRRRRTTSRPIALGLSRRRAVRRAGHLHHGRLGPHRRGDQPPGRQEVPALDQRRPARPRSRNGRSGAAEERPAPGGRTGPNGWREKSGGLGPGPRSGQGTFKPPRGRPGLIREGEVVGG